MSSRRPVGSLSKRKLVKLEGLFGGVEEEDNDEGFIMAITGMMEGRWCEREGFEEGGLVSISGMMFSLPFIRRRWLHHTDLR